MVRQARRGLVKIRLESTKFRNAVRKLSTKIAPNLLTVALKKIMFDLLASVIQMTPVDTGRARHGWISWLDKEGLSVSTPGGTDRGRREGKAASSYSEDLTGPKRYIAVSNNVAYIVWLEFGHSRQAPRGMLRVSMRRMRQGLKKAF